MPAQRRGAQTHRAVPAGPLPFSSHRRTQRSLLPPQTTPSPAIAPGACSDCFAVDIGECPGLGLAAPRCRGCDGSLISTRDEMLRPENAYKKWAARVAVPTRLIASAFGASLADTIIFGAAVGTQYLSNGRVQILGRGLRMGRHDTTEAAPDGQLPDSTVRCWRAAAGGRRERAFPQTEGGAGDGRKAPGTRTPHVQVTSFARRPMMPRCHAPRARRRQYRPRPVPLPTSPSSNLTRPLAPPFAPHPLPPLRRRSPRTSSSTSGRAAASRRRRARP